MAATDDVEIVYENDKPNNNNNNKTKKKKKKKNKAQQKDTSKASDKNKNGEQGQTNTSEIIGSLETTTNTFSSTQIANKTEYLIRNNLEYLVLALAIFALIMSILILCIISGVLNSAISKQEETYNNVLASALHYEGTNIMDESQIIHVGNYYGWSFANYRNSVYRSSKNDYQSGNDVQYPFADIYVRYGDKLIFKRIDESLKDDLLLVSEKLYTSCDFAPFSDSEGMLDENKISDSSEISRLASEKDLYSENGNQKYIIQINSSVPDILRFTSSYKWDSKHGGSCLGGLKVKVIIIDRSYREVMDVKTSSDKWRGIESTQSVVSLDASIGHVSRMLILKQFNYEQRIRSDGDSGLANVETLYDGNAAYDDGTYTNYASGSIHDHSEHLYLIGIGEIEAILNGVEFRTNHSDYYLNMPSTKSSEYDAIQAIQLPNVPKEVLNAGSIENQISEMQEYFRAFKNQDISHRDYTQYFKPILCYLEGTWTVNNNNENNENAFNINDKIRWMANNGRDNINMNTNVSLSYLPLSIRNLMNNTYPKTSIWDYRIVCHPLHNNIATSRFRISNDLNIQLYAAAQSVNELYFSDETRFDLNKYINLNNISGDNQWANGRKQYNYLDYLMEQIPGKDNYIGNVTDRLPDNSGPIMHSVNDTWFNVAYYSRYYKLSENDAMGSTSHRRSYCDRNLFAAKTTQINVSAIEMNFEVENETTNEIKYYPTISRWSYAIPLEIIYLTPLTQWNPYNIEKKDGNKFDYNRNGKCNGQNDDDVFDGYANDNAYFTPAKFYNSESEICAFGKDGKIYNVAASGHYITLPEIGGNVGKIRQRYPIFPIHNGGSSSFKELKALQAVVIGSDNYSNINSSLLLHGITLSLSGGGHKHMIYIPAWKIFKNWYNSITNEWLMSSENIIEIDTNQINKHCHTLQIWIEKHIILNQLQYHIKQCRFGTISDSDNVNNPWIENKCYDFHNQIHS